MKRKEKVIYISTWDYRFNGINEMQFYVEFELINEDTLESESTVKRMSGILLNNLLDEIKDFIEN